MGWLAFSERTAILSTNPPTPEQWRAHYLEPVGLGDEIELMAEAKVAKVG